MSTFSARTCPTFELRLCRKSYSLPISAAILTCKLLFENPKEKKNVVPNFCTIVYISLLSHAPDDDDESKLPMVVPTETNLSHTFCFCARFLPCRFTLLFSHGNAVDLGQMTSFFIGLGQRINCNIFSYDYSGYGMSTGKPTEKNLYADIDAAWHALRTRYGISPENIILYGQSIGTVPTVDLASRYEVGAVILHSPLMSGMRVAFPATKRTWFFDAFPR